MPKGQYKRTPEMRARWADNMRRVRTLRGPGFGPGQAEANRRRREDPEAHARAAQVAGDVRRRWMDEHPAEIAAARTESGGISSAKAWQCDDCLRVIVGPSIGRHQKATGHEGRTLVDDPRGAA